MGHTAIIMGAMNRPIVIILIVLVLLGGALLIRKLRTPKSIFAEPLIPTPLYEPGPNEVQNSLPAGTTTGR